LSLYQQAIEALNRKKAGRSMEQPKSVDAILSALAALRISTKLSDDGKTIFATSYNHRDTLKQMGFRWNGEDKTWYLSVT
jgi:hypothetical protein